MPIKCEECGKDAVRITHLHLRMHGMTTEDYKRKYPNAPLTSDEHKLNLKYRRSPLFLKDTQVKEPQIENEKPQEVITDDGFYLPDETVDDKDFEIDSSLENIEDSRPVSSFKAKYILALKGLLPNLEENYYIRKFTLFGHLTYQYMTDMADPIKKIDIEMPETYWHNDLYRNEHIRKIHLEQDGWTIISMKGTSPSVEKLVEEVEHVLRTK